MSFDVPAEAYDRYMGRYSSQLSAQMADLAGVRAGQRVIDVGCGPGALTRELVARLGVGAVAAVDPSQQFVTAARERNPGVDVRLASAEDLPFADGTFDAAIAQLVVHFMADPIVGLTEMRRVVKDGGVLAACVWDHSSSQGPLSLFWTGAHQIEADVADESELPGAREGHLAELFAAAGLREVMSSVVTASVEHASFDAWWEPFTFGVGPAGSFLASLEADRQAELREACRALVHEEPFMVRALAWAARGLV